VSSAHPVELDCPKFAARDGPKDWDIARHAQENDFVFVTNNAADFRALYATQELHPGLVILIPNVRADLQRRLFTGALEQLVVTCSSRNFRRPCPSNAGHGRPAI
jgi:predicted nuclease of predicted toxin-antitoxin system